MSLLKSNHLIYLFFKSKGFKDFYKNKKTFTIIKDLNLIDEESYLKFHPDCLNEKMDVNIHYIFYGFKDEISIKKSYINPIFDLEFYKNTYPCEDPILDYVLSGFYNGNKINCYDNNFIKDITKSLNQFYINQDNFIKKYIENNNYIIDEDVLIPYIENEDEYKSNKIRIGVFVKDSFDKIPVCPYIRIHAPFKELSKSGKYTFFMYGEDVFTKMDLNNIINSKQFDIIVVQRIIPFLNVILQKAKEHNIKIIYETDDDLLSVEENSPSFNYINRYRNSLVEFIDNADVITVTTENLASKFKNNNVEVIKNYLNFSKIANGINNNSKIKLGYCGTLTHSKDLFLIKDVIIELKKLMKNKHGLDVDFEVIGGFNAADNISQNWYTKIELPDFAEDFEKFREWFVNRAKWDIGIVPLEDSEFNRSKSELKYIDLTAIGVPGVYSDMEVYSNVIEDGYNGLLANSKNEWIKKLETLILDKKLREEIYKNAKEDILKNYTLNERVKQWDNILSNL